MKYKDFEDFLRYYHAENYPRILDDELPDAYQSWLADLCADDWIDLGNKYALKVMDYAISVTEKSIK